MSGLRAPRRRGPRYDAGYWTGGPSSIGVDAVLSRHGSARSTRGQGRRGVAWIAAAFLAAGCTAHVRGLIAPVDGRPVVTTIEGKRYGLVLFGDAAALAALDGHLVQVDGPHALGLLGVTRWRVLDGLSGMTPWIGRVAVLGSQVGLEERGTATFYWLDDQTSRALRDHPGALVLVEGYVDGPHRIRALSVRALESRDPVR